MTDNEIIQALKCCEELNHNGWDYNIKICKEECPYKANCYNEEKNINMITDVLDLIKRKDEQIEALIAGQETLQKALNEKIEEVEKITEVYSNLIIEKDELFEEAERLIKQAKSEAVKEFAERLKDCFKGDNVCDFLFVRIAINNLVKEMVGETDV